MKKREKRSDNLSAKVFKIVCVCFVTKEVTMKELLERANLLVHQFENEHQRRLWWEKKIIFI